MRKFGRIDRNHKRIVDLFRQLGCSVLSMSSLGNGVPDLLVARCGHMALVEVKDGAKCPSARKLTPDQIDFRCKWNAEVHVVTTDEEAISLVQNVL